ncbi:hypothetical protein [Sporofaciens musculi]|nr:hypothetical protein [Sporofaciens musculi]
MICRGKGENKEDCDRVIEDILKQWEENVCGKTTNQKGDEANEVD